MVTDPIADFLTRVRNAQMAGHRIVEIPASNLKRGLLKFFTTRGTFSNTNLRMTANKA